MVLEASSHTHFPVKITVVPKELQENLQWGAGTHLGRAAHQTGGAPPTFRSHSVATRAPEDFVPCANLTCPLGGHSWQVLTPLVHSTKGKTAVAVIFTVEHPTGTHSMQNPAQIEKSEQHKHPG